MVAIGMAVIASAASCGRTGMEAPAFSAPDKH